MVPKIIQNMPKGWRIHSHSDQHQSSAELQKACCHSKGEWKATWGFTGVLFCSCQGFFFLPEEIHIPYICLNEFCKLAICSVPVTHAALWTEAVQTSALTWNTVFVWLSLHYSSATHYTIVYTLHFSYNWSCLIHCYIKCTPHLQM